MQSKALTIIAALVAAFLAQPAFAQLSTTPPSQAAAHSVVISIPPQDLASTTVFLNAQALAGAVAGSTSYAVSAANPSVPGRNVVLTPNDNDNDSSLIVTWAVDGYDQFYVPISETLSTTGDTAATGSKIFSVVTRVRVTSLAGLEASDTVSLGTGEKVGIPRMFSSDLHEIKQASLVNAAGTGITAITINSTNFDTTYFALNAAVFSSNSVDDGDQVYLLFLTDPATPNNRFFPSR